VGRDALRRIAALYKIEESIRGQSAEARCKIRQAKTRPKRAADGFAWGNPLWLVLAAEELNLLDQDDFARAHHAYAPEDPLLQPFNPSRRTRSALGRCGSRPQKEPAEASWFGRGGFFSGQTAESANTCDLTKRLTGVSLSIVLEFL
jgi:hypothetical protein